MQEAWCSYCFALIHFLPRQPLHKRVARELPQKLTSVLRYNPVTLILQHLEAYPNMNKIVLLMVLFFYQSTACFVLMWLRTTVT